MQLTRGFFPQWSHCPPRIDRTFCTFQLLSIQAPTALTSIIYSPFCSKNIIKCDLSCTCCPAQNLTKARRLFFSWYLRSTFCNHFPSGSAIQSYQDWIVSVGMVVSILSDPQSTEIWSLQFFIHFLVQLVVTISAAQSSSVHQQITWANGIRSYLEFPLIKSYII